MISLNNTKKVVIFFTCIYVFFESYFNYQILASTSDINVENLEKVSDFGHKISSVGITLITVPFLINKLKIQNLLIIICLSMSSLLVSYYGINQLINTALVINQDKKHDAFYLSVLKYGILLNKLSYSSFIQSENVNSIDDKILLNSIFIISHSDKEIISKIKSIDKRVIANIYVDTFGLEEYKLQYQSFTKLSNEVKQTYEKFTASKVLLSKNLILLKNSDSRKKYDSLIDSLKHKYATYRKASQKIESVINEEKKYKNINSIYKRLKYYFKHQGETYAENKYKEIMNRKFNLSIPPSIWLNNANELSLGTIRRALLEKIPRLLLEGIPLELHYNQFIAHETIRNNTQIELAKLDILIPDDFNFSYKDFDYYYQNMVSKKINLSIKKYYSKLEKEIGKNDLKLEYGWEDYLSSNFFINKLRATLEKNSNYIDSESK